MGQSLEKKPKNIMDAGGLVPDAVTIGIVKERLAQPDCGKGFILDGFPRTKDQAVALDGILKDLKLKLTAVVNIAVPDANLVKRVTGRRICKTCGATYHVTFNPPAVEGKCDKCGGVLYQRDDDKEATVIKRCGSLSQPNSSSIAYYQNKGVYKEVDGTQPIDKVYAEVVAAVKE